MSDKHFSRDELERRREKLKDDRYRCYRCGEVETPILVGDVGDGAECGEPDDKVLGYACENPECVSPLIASIETVSDTVERTEKRSLESVHDELRRNV
jgi:hypothetical protein